MDIPLGELPQRLPPDQVIEIAEGLVQQGQTDAARRLLLALGEKAPDPVQREFLLGMIALQEQRAKDAIARFRGILRDRPELVRVRLELAHALYLDGQDSGADHHFRLALAEQPPGTVQRNIQSFLNQIRSRKRWDLQVEFSLLPDSNANAAPDDTIIEIFGLPFELDQAAREDSSLGLYGRVDGSYWHPITKRVRWLVNGAVQHSEYFDNPLDDTLVTGETGPSLLWRGGQISLAAIGFRRWFAGQSYNWGAGGRISLQQDIGRRWQIGGRVSLQDIGYDRRDDLDGTALSSLIFVSYRLDSRSFLRGHAGFAYEWAMDKGFEHESWRVGLGWYRELGFGLSVFVQPEYLRRDYKAEQTAFGAVRQDDQIRLQLEFLKRDWTFWGFAPKVSYAYTHNDSNISFYDYERHRGQLGFTRTF